jgi:hypothetical protein
MTPNSLTSLIVVNGTGIITPVFDKAVKLSLKPASLSVIHGSLVSTTARISGAKQTVSISLRGLPTGTKFSWSKGSSLKDSLLGVTDKLTIATTNVTAKGTYTITFVVAGADGQKSTTTLILKIS